MHRNANCRRTLRRIRFLSRICSPRRETEKNSGQGAIFATCYVTTRARHGHDLLSILEHTISRTSREKEACCVSEFALANCMRRSLEKTNIPLLLDRAECLPSSPCALGSALMFKQELPLCTLIDPEPIAVRVDVRSFESSCSPQDGLLRPTS